MNYTIMDDVLHCTMQTLRTSEHLVGGGGGGGIWYEYASTVDLILSSTREQLSIRDAHTPALLLMLGSGICFALGLATLKGLCFLLLLYSDARTRDLLRPEFSNIKGTVSLTHALL
jgi:hypothetical protein